MKRLKRFVETWRSAKADPGNGELTYRMWGSYDRTHVVHGWWVNPDDWGIGIGYLNDWYGSSVTWAEDRRMVDIQIGPFIWHISVVRTQGAKR